MFQFTEFLRKIDLDPTRVRLLRHGALLVFKDEPHRLMVELKLRATSFLLLTYRMER